MLKELLRNTILFLRQPRGTGLLAFLVACGIFSLQPQPWPMATRLLLAVLPAALPAALAILSVRYYDRLHTATVRLSLLAFALLSWVILLIDIGPGFLAWILVFSLALLFVFLVAVRFTAAFALGMLFFACFYGSLRLHQAEQLLYLNMLVRKEQQASALQLSVNQTGNRLTILADQQPILTLPLPEGMQRLEKTKTNADGFFGITPALILSVDPEDERAIPMAAVLVVPVGFASELWNVQVSSDLEKLHRQGNLGPIDMKRREGRCGPQKCDETIWLYEDRFQATQVQAGYVLFRTADTETGHNLMIWFREPSVEGFPHHPRILELMKGLTFTATAETAN